MSPEGGRTRYLWDLFLSEPFEQLRETALKQLKLEPGQYQIVAVDGSPEGAVTVRFVDVPID